MKKFFVALALLSIFGATELKAQYASEYDGGLVVKLNPEGSKYVRFILWGQTWFQDYEGKHANDGFSIKRARVLAYSQINDRFMILTHFGANGIYDNNLSPMGKSTDVSFFLHEMFLQYKVTNNLAIGAGVHNFGGISRGNGQGSINMLTLDNNRADWSTLGLSDQFSNHLGMFAKGRIGKLNYRLALSDAITNTLDGNSSTVLQNGQEKYLGKAILGEGKYAVSGYFDYQFLDQESNALPYRVGTYLGTKKVFNIGAGFFNQSNAIVKKENDNLIGENVTHLAVDAFYDAPIGKSSSITAYAKYQNSDMGENYVQGNVVGDGNQFSGHVGYLLPKNIKEGEGKFRNRIQPYVGYSYRDFKGLVKPANELKLGGNWYIDGQNAKISVEYQKSFDQPKHMDDMITIQAMILL
ncbi:hypothetical protein HXZ62_05500 [Empedobacter falsenii]|uniref:hypothetical protein n=1 Tax=Empedobacter falsenii TaxID=343874 RepID=UPI00257843A1|nr:hypothetical protein [Empedobacter falsenii]MDM1062022.1 hypothetical protein [Empedobacter falsenii]